MQDPQHKKGHPKEPDRLSEMAKGRKRQDVTKRPAKLLVTDLRRWGLTGFTTGVTAIVAITIIGAALCRIDLAFAVAFRGRRICWVH
ncbi:hypothetical protein [Pedobacter sp. 22226]|uniref:hypothetical protein n=1 Tax=Pedobacter sp. 22226 TaxID=3453894 RepID=UPI003F83E318